MRRILIVSVFLFSLPAFAQTSGPASAIKPGFDKQAALEGIFLDLAQAENHLQSKIFIDRLWTTWMMAPDQQAAEDLNRALRARRGYNFDKALKVLNAIIERHPSYPEAWNQRSYVHFLKEDYEKSLADCKKALTFEPRHIGCLSGMARILIRHQKRYSEGKELLEKAIKLHPFIYEKVLLQEIPQENL